MRRKPLWHKFIYFLSAFLCFLVLATVVYLSWFFTPAPLPSIHILGPYTNNSSSAELIPFDLESADTTLPLQGTLGIPNQTTSTPLVFMLCGPYLHDTRTGSRADQGFDYLTKALADSGYFVVAINLPAPDFLGLSDTEQEQLLIELFTAHLDSLQHSIVEGDNRYNTSFANIADFSDFIIFSHGLQYQYIDTLTTTLSDLYPSSALRANILVSPKYSTRHTPSLIDTPTLIVLPELDGVVTSLDGQKLFEDMYTNPDFVSNAYLTFVKGANHTHFNSVIHYDDTKLPTGYTNISLSETEQQDFLTQHVIDFINYTLDKLPYSELFEPDSPTPSTLYGYQALISSKPEASLTLLSPSSLTIPYYNELGGAIHLKNASLSCITNSYLTSNDTSDGFNPPGNFISLDLLRLNWTTTSSLLTTYIPTPYSDVSEFDSLRFRIALDPSHSLNTRNTPQSFTLELRDTSGARQRLIVPTTSAALGFSNGVLQSYLLANKWSNSTPISDLTIPLSYFENIDITNLYSISFILDQHPTGSLIIQDLSFIR